MIFGNQRKVCHDEDQDIDRSSGRRDPWHRSRRHPQPAEAGGNGGAVAAGVLGGLAAGAIIGSAAANGPYYAPGPVYYGGCYWTRERFWDGWGWRWRRVHVCD